MPRNPPSGFMKLRTAPNAVSGRLVTLFDAEGTWRWKDSNPGSLPWRNLGPPHYGGYANTCPSGYGIPRNERDKVLGGGLPRCTAAGQGFILVHYSRVTEAYE